MKGIVRNSIGSKAEPNCGSVPQKGILIQWRSYLRRLVRPHHVVGVGLPRHRRHFHPPRIPGHSIFHTFSFHVSPA